MPKLRPYQLEAVREIYDKKKVLLADDMGLGKTAEAISAKNLIEKRQGYDSRTLYVCPTSVMPHIEKEIRLWYRKGENTRTTQIQTTTYEKDVDEIKNSDFVIIGYPTLSYLGKNPAQMRRLEEIGFQYGIIDEGQNVKNPKALRSMAVKHLFDSIDYLAILTGTPIPNNVVDIYMLLSLLDKNNFPISSSNAKAILKNFYILFREDPAFVRVLLNDKERMLRRTVDYYLNEKFPDLRQHNLEVKLDGEHREAYIKVYENDDIKPGSKLIQLRKAAIDPNLVRSDILGDLSHKKGNMESCVYKSLDSLVERIIDEKGKILIFSSLKIGVTRKLCEGYSKYGSVVIEGGVESIKYNGDTSIREEIRRKFQNDPNCKILITTTVMDEGVDLTAATDIVHLTTPYTPATFDQRNRRSQRIGEIKKDYVNSYLIKIKVDDLIPSVTDGLERLLEDKRKIINYILENPFLITREDLNELKEGRVHKSRHLKLYVRHPVRTLFNHLTSLKAQGFKYIDKYYETHLDEARNIALLYANYWEGYYGGNTANLYTKVIKILEEKKNLERKIDIASGPFSLSRKLKEPVVNVDLNPFMFEAGRILENKGIIVSGNIAHGAPFHQLPFENESFDLAVCSLALHMSKIKLKHEGEEIRERESVFREMNRILTKDGLGILTLPYSIIAESDVDRFYEGLNKLGFNVLPFSGLYKGPTETDFKVYLGGLQKREGPCKENLDEELLIWDMDRELLRKRSSKKERKHPISPKPKKEIKKEFVDEFYHTNEGKSLEEVVREAI